jgi:hypothetical protein
MAWNGDGMVDIQNDDDDQRFIKDLLKRNGPMFTSDIVDALMSYKKDAASPDCSDRTMRNLIFMKQKGMIAGKMNREKRTWEWSLLR